MAEPFHDPPTEAGFFWHWSPHVLRWTVVEVEATAVGLLVYALGMEGADHIDTVTPSWGPRAPEPGVPEPVVPADTQPLD